MRSLLLAPAVAATVLAAPAWAGPAHVLFSQILDPAAADAGYVVAPSLDERTRKALTEGLTAAGLRVASPDQPHAYVVTVQSGAGALCTRSCSALTLHDDANLDDYYRHSAVVAAQPNTGTAFAPGAPVAWFTVLQSDGLSKRRADYLPALLRYGARAYGRSTASEAPPRLEPAPSILPPNITSTPGA